MQQTVDHRAALKRQHAATLFKGLSFIAVGAAFGIAVSSHDSLAKALACGALVVEIGSAIVVMRRSLKGIDKLIADEQRRAEAAEQRCVEKEQRCGRR